MYHQECSLLFITPVHIPSAIAYSGASQDDSDSLCASVEVGNSQGLWPHPQRTQLRPEACVCAYMCIRSVMSCSCTTPFSKVTDSL